jgi:hypothetical protein
MPSTEYLIRLKSEDLTQYLRETASWVPGEKLEYDIDVAADEEKTLNFGDIDRVRFFGIFTDAPLIVTFTKDTNEIAFTVQDMMVFSPTVEFLTGLTGVSVKAASSAFPAHVKVRLYGEAEAES